MTENSSKSPQRHPPEHEYGIKRVQVGCGPHNVMPEWWNVDIREFKGIDSVMDVTKSWPWDGILDYVYGEHFLEHLELAGSISFLRSALLALRPGGKIRLSTPALEWVLATHFDLESKEDDKKIRQTFVINRAFHGWGHRFLYSRAFLKKIVTSVGFCSAEFFEYGQSGTPDLANLERHGGYCISGGLPSVWNIEATRPVGELVPDDVFLARCADEYVRYIASGH